MALNPLNRSSSDQLALKGLTLCWNLDLLPTVVMKTTGKILFSFSSVKPQRNRSDDAMATDVCGEGDSEQ